MKLTTRISRLLLFLALLTGLAFAAPLAPPPKGGFTIAVLPDTQMYAWKDPDIYSAQTKWIAENVKSHNILLVLHLGDVTQHNTPEQWQAARAAHDLLKGKVPCAILPGNHDLGADGKAATRETLLTKFFPVSEFRQWPSFGGVYDKEPDRSENNYHRWTAAGRKWLVIALEFAPRNDVLRWAGDVAKKHSDHSVILVTHAYLRTDNTRYNRHEKMMVKGKERNKGLDSFALSRLPDGFNDGEDIWQKLVSQHPNFVLVVSGHTCVTGRRTDTGKHGNPVHQMVVDYQNQDQGGAGFLRLLQFSPDGSTIRAVDYSPLLHRFSSIPDTDFVFQLPPAPSVKQ